VTCTKYLVAREYIRQWKDRNMSSVSVCRRDGLVSKKVEAQPKTLHGKASVVMGWHMIKTCI
jgi:hypothetical protein